MGTEAPPLSAHGGGQGNRACRKHETRRTERQEQGPEAHLKPGTPKQPRPTPRRKENTDTNPARGTLTPPKTLSTRRLNHTQRHQNRQRGKTPAPLTKTKPQAVAPPPQHNSVTAQLRAPQRARAAGQLGAPP
jgi:hypothetical protein